MARTAVSFICICLSVCLLATVRAQSNSTANTITVSGYGNIQSLSDTASVSVQVSSTQDLASTARQNVSTTVSAIISALAKTQYNNTDGTYIRLGYQFQHSLQINIQNVTSQLLAGVIDVVVSQGSEISINSISFGLSSGIKNKLWLEGRNAAVADARGTAQLYAKALGVQLGRIATLQEVSGTDGSASYSQNAGAPLVATDAANSTAMTSAVSIGQQTVTIQVTAVYQLLPRGASAPAGAAAPAASQPSLTAGRRLRA
ncbi:hypothetical protein WJX81_006797 [Elliptochloris bilobata]|uniref:DUF541 domain-containing protein n=1 Tax=Elliptochloris bilobata TaxID=381761 RepID=A0AAW1RGE2_9CHLO